MQSKPLPMGIGNSSDKIADSNIRRNSSTSEYAIKVRKPYTISKQRERWTDEEHEKFLEALKLYGRAWRKIEEHIGTKTAVQIRSHAQKFFAKVSHESNGDDSDGTNAIEIPPPRPKRKPSHPYPRKLENMLVTPNIKVEAQENMSPTSVISTDAFNSSESSPVSCVNQSELFKISLSEDRCQSGTTSVEDESKSNSQNNSDTDVSLLTGDSTAAKEASSLEESKSSLKLFGKTLVVPETCKPQQYPTEETNHQLYFWPNDAGPMFCLVPIWGLYGDSELHMPPAQMVMSSSEGESSSCAEDSGNSNVELGTTESRSMNIGIDSETCKFRQSETSAFRSFKARPKRTESRGFVPYRSCVLAEREVSQKIGNDIGGEGEVRLYL